MQCLAFRTSMYRSMPCTMTFLIDTSKANDAIYCNNIYAFPLLFCLRCMAIRLKILYNFCYSMPKERINIYSIVLITSKHLQKIKTPNTFMVCLVTVHTAIEGSTKIFQDSWAKKTIILAVFYSVVILQLSDLSLVTVNLTLKSFNLLFVVINFIYVVLLQSSQLLLLLTP